MDAAPLFLARCKQIEAAMVPTNEIELLDLSAHLRQLLIDQTSPLHIVNRERSESRWLSRPHDPLPSRAAAICWRRDQVCGTSCRRSSPSDSPDLVGRSDVPVGPRGQRGIYTRTQKHQRPPLSRPRASARGISGRAREKGTAAWLKRAPSTSGQAARQD
jgi:hypothetical protein